MQYLSLKKWKQALKEDREAIILDVRTQEEYQLEHIPGAQQLNVHEPRNFMKEIENLDKSKNYYVYCRSGNRSLQACQVLDFNGFKHTFSLEGGYEKWRENPVTA